MHIPVLLKESINLLDPRPGNVIVDTTVNGGGHSEEIMKKMGEEGKLVAIDQDEVALSRLRERWAGRKNIFLINDNFRNLDKILDSLKIKKINGAIFDIGLSSNQFEQSGRGFTFRKEEPLLMTMGAQAAGAGLTAREIVNSWNENDLADLIFNYGEERYSRKIAANIVRRRRQKPIETTFELVDVIRESVPGFYRNSRGINCATRTFQALRIAVNDELGALQDGIGKAWKFLDREGRIAVISFHSLEDRIVKNFLKEKVALSEAKLLAKKPIIPGEEEIKANPRARSAKLRAAEKLIR